MRNKKLFYLAFALACVLTLFAICIPVANAASVIVSFTPEIGYINADKDFIEIEIDSDYDNYEGYEVQFIPVSLLFKR